MLEERIEAMNAQTEKVIIEDSAYRRVYTPEEIQSILSVSKTTIYQLLKSNVFHSVKVGGQYRISKKSFDKWLEGTGQIDEGELNNEE